MVQEQKRKKGFYFSDILSKKKKNQTGILDGSCKTGGGG